MVDVTGEYERSYTMSVVSSRFARVSFRGLLLQWGVAVTVLAGWGCSGDAMKCKTNVDCIAPHSCVDGACQQRSRFVSLSVGDQHGCVLQSDGRPLCWGDNEYGQTDVALGHFDMLSAGFTRTCALRTSDNAVVCWGGEGDEPTNELQSAPNGTLQTLSLGPQSICGIRPNGGVVCWKNPRDRQLPDMVDGDFLDVSTGISGACAIESDQTVSCWGIPRLIAPPFPQATYKQVATSGFHTCALRTDGHLDCWGAGSREGEDSPTSGDFDQALPPEGTFSSVSVGSDHSCAIRTDQSVTCWGRDDHGQASPPMGSFTMIDAGGDSTCGVRSNDTIECWGELSGFPLNER